MIELKNCENLPIDPQGNPIAPSPQPGFYPGYSTLSQRNFWDEATRNAVLQRMQTIPLIRFFSSDEVRLLTSVVNRIMPQDDRDQDHRIPIVPFIDKRLSDGTIDGYRFEKMPPDNVAYRLGLQGIEDCAKAKYGQLFFELEPYAQEEILRSIHDAKPVSGHDIWEKVNVRGFWFLLLHDVCHVYYAHPWAWDEIGFGGPAYPRGYMRLENGEPEPWEMREQRYEWMPPVYSKSHLFEYVAGKEEHYGSPGQGGTH